MLLFSGKRKKKASKLPNKILSSSGPNHIFELLLPSSSNEIDQSENFFRKENEPLVKLQSIKRLQNNSDSLKGIIH